MIFKIKGDFNEDNFSKILNKLCKYFKFIYTNQTLYIALSDIKNKQEASNLMSKTFRPVRSYYIKEINEKNIMNEEQSVMEWRVLYECFSIHYFTISYKRATKWNYTCVFSLQRWRAR